MKTVSLFALAGIAFVSNLLADEALPQAQAVEIEAAPDVAICRMPAPASLIKELKEMEANEESIQSILNNEKAKTTVEKLKAPIVINSMEEALKHLTRASMEKVADVVDFDKQQVVIFAWQGSGQDRLNGYLSPGKGTTANFQYNLGQNEDLRTHTAIYAMPKGTEIQVSEVPRIIRCGVVDGGALQIEPLQLNGKQLKFELKVQPAPKAE